MNLIIHSSEIDPRKTTNVGSSTQFPFFLMIPPITHGDEHLFEDRVGSHFVEAFGLLLEPDFLYLSLERVYKPAKFRIEYKHIGALTKLRECDSFRSCFSTLCDQKSDASQIPHVAVGFYVLRMFLLYIE
jgi:hypothetical protein